MRLVSWEGLQKPREILYLIKGNSFKCTLCQIWLIIRRQKSTMCENNFKFIKQNDPVKAVIITRLLSLLL